MSSRTKIVLCVVILGNVAATAALANDKDDYPGGFVIPDSTVGVNPVYHPEYFGGPPDYACFARFHAYEVTSETYLGGGGRRHPCRRR